MSAHESTNGSDWSGKSVFTTGEAARVCGVSQQTIIRCFDSGKLKGFRVPGSRFRRIPRADLLVFMQANEIPTTALERPKPRVLVVDADPHACETLCDQLARAAGPDSIEMRGVSSGYDAGYEAAAFRPDLIVLADAPSGLRAAQLGSVPSSEDPEGPCAALFIVEGATRNGTPSDGDIDAAIGWVADRTGTRGADPG